MTTSNGESKLQLLLDDLSSVLRSLDDLESGNLAHYTTLMLRALRGVDEAVVAWSSSLLERDLAADVVSQATGIMMAAAHHVSKSGLSPACKFVADPVDDPWKLLCARCVVVLLRKVYPQLGSSNEKCRDARKQVVVAARAVSRHLSTDLMHVHFRPASVHDAQVDPEVDKESLELWSLWVPQSVEHYSVGGTSSWRETHPSSDIETTTTHRTAADEDRNEMGRFAFLLMESLRRWCLEFLDCLDALDAKDAATSSKWMSPFAFSAVESLASRIAIVHAASYQSSMSCLDSAAGLPVNIMASFSTVWTRLSERLRSAMVEPPVERVLDLSLDESCVTNTTGNANNSDSSSGDLVESLLHGLHGDLSEVTVQRVMSHLAKKQSDAIHDLRSRLSTLRAHNQTLAARIANTSSRRDALEAVHQSFVDNGFVQHRPITQAPWPAAIVRHHMDSLQASTTALAGVTASTPVALTDAVIRCLSVLQSHHVPTTDDMERSRLRSSSAMLTFDEDDKLAQKEAEVDRLIKRTMTPRTMTPRCTPRPSALQSTDANLLVSPISDDGGSL